MALLFHLIERFFLERKTAKLDENLIKHLLIGDFKALNLLRILLRIVLAGIARFFRDKVFDDNSIVQIHMVSLAEVGDDFGNEGGMALPQ